MMKNLCSHVTHDEFEEDIFSSGIEFFDQDTGLSYSSNLNTS